MWQIGVWEHGEGLAERISTLTRSGTALVRACSHPASLAGIELDLLIVSPGATGWAGASALCSHHALLPGGFSTLTRALPSGAAISYGPSGRNTISLSGLNEGFASVAVQQGFSTLGGHTVERQELVIPFDGSIPPDLFLAQVGAALLLDRLPRTP